MDVFADVAGLVERLFGWEKAKNQPKSWAERLTVLSASLQKGRAGTGAAEEVIALADEAGYASPELEALRRRERLAIEHDRGLVAGLPADAGHGKKPAARKKAAKKPGARKKR